MCVGSGVVTSVPSDAPDDYAALRDLKKKKVSTTTTVHVYTCTVHTHVLYTVKLLMLVATIFSVFASMSN